MGADGTGIFQHDLSAEVHSCSPSVEATPKANWFLHLMFLLPFSSSGGEGVGG
jgi:hypothetical protein